MRGQIECLVLVAIWGLVAAKTTATAEAGRVSITSDRSSPRYESESILREAALASLQKTWGGVSALRIEYHATATAPNISDEPLPVTHRIMAFRRLNGFYHFGGHSTAESPLAEDPLSQSLLINGRVGRHLWVFNRAALEFPHEPGDPLPGSSAHETLFAALPTWIVAHCRAPSEDSVGRDVIAQEALASPHYHVDKQIDSYSGKPCYLLRSDQAGDRIWLAASPSNSYYVIRRESTSLDGSRRWGRLLARSKLLQSGGVAFPESYVYREYQGEAFGDENLCIKDSQFDITAFQVNDAVDPLCFDTEYSPGTIQLTDSAFEQVTPGGEGLLDSIVNVLRQRRKKSTSSTSLNKADYFFISIGLFGGAYLGAHMTTRRPRGYDPREPAVRARTHRSELLALRLR